MFWIWMDYIFENVIYILRKKKFFQLFYVLNCFPKMYIRTNIINKILYIKNYNFIQC